MPCRFTRNHCACAPMAVPSRMKLTMREPASMTTDKGSRRMTSDFYSALLDMRVWVFFKLRFRGVIFSRGPFVWRYDEKREKVDTGFPTLTKNVFMGIQTPLNAAFRYTDSKFVYGGAWVFPPSLSPFLQKFLYSLKKKKKKVEWIIHSIYGVKRLHSLRSEFHSILTPVEWEFTTQRVKFRPVHSIFTPKEVVTDLKEWK